MCRKTQWLGLNRKGLRSGEANTKILLNVKKPPKIDRKRPFKAVDASFRRPLTSFVARLLRSTLAIRAALRSTTRWESCVIFGCYIPDTKLLYEETGKNGSFSLLHCWVILRNARKWQDIAQRTTVPTSRTKASDPGEDPEDINSETRPVGRKAKKLAPKRDRETLEEATVDQIKNKEIMVDLTKKKVTMLQQIANEVIIVKDTTAMTQTA
ncbi:hypothetical protein PsorP6_005091 [Peronosclerospora sorghi]|uniref:Uncharacterized protein n=1 Tax=Peronosclerospora sorghi TaxID=230839 RepID=A0ACC0W2J7_9STRA|nr:hypothetical protein PsorP6_005091 [Peronosclerospora sorghi]